ncbi:hypothetical protein LTR85_011088 [Meristemomyces frigidus]|nr:hypothetical protein LTR85_011088 [Meristemomyces frigidus]
MRHAGPNGFDANNQKGKEKATKAFRHFLGQCKRYDMLEGILGRGALYAVATREGAHKWRAMDASEPGTGHSTETILRQHPDLPAFFAGVADYVEALLKGVEMPAPHLIEAGQYNDHQDPSLELLETASSSGPRGGDDLPSSSPSSRSSSSDREMSDCGDAEH